MFLHAKFLRFFCVILVFVPGILSFSCSNSIDHMLEDYNSNFVHPTADPRALEPGDPDFDEKTLLLPIYNVATNASLNIPVSKKAKRVTWYLKKLHQNTGENESLYFSNSNPFAIYMPDYRDEIPEGTYCLTLTLEIASGEVFHDEAYVCVYDYRQCTNNVN